MVGLLKPTSQESEIRSAGNHLSNLLGQIRPHRLSLLSLFGAASGDAVAQNRPQARVPQPETRAVLAERANASTVTVISGTVSRVRSSRSPTICPSSLTRATACASCL